MNSIIQDWAAELGLRHQGVLVSAVRGCDGLPRETVGKDVVRFYRSCLLKAHVGHPADASSYMAWPSSETQMWDWGDDFFDGGMDHYPMHWLTHFMFAAEICGYYYPKKSPHSDYLDIQEFWRRFYRELVRRLHLNPETKEQLDKRLNRDEDAFSQAQAAQ